MELVKYEVYLLGKNKRYILKIFMARATSTFKLVYIDTTYIISINIDSVTSFSNLINNYFKYCHINIYI